MFRAPLTALALVACLLPVTASAQALEGFEPTGPEVDGLTLDGQVEWTQPGTLREIARFGDSANDYVAWHIDDATGDISTAIAVTFPNKPLLAAELAEKLDPIESFLAVAGPDAVVPDALLDAKPVGAELPAMDLAARESLHQANLVALAKMRTFVADSRTATKSGCSASFKNWVAAVYGSSTCGNTGSNGFTWTYPADTYCTSGCDYKLGEYDKGSCSPALASCDVVTGTAHNRQQRWSNVNGTYNMGYWGHHAHYGAASCLGSNGPINVERTRGGSVYNTTVPVNGMKHWFQGAWGVPVSAQNFVTYGQWSYGIPASGTLFKYNKLRVTNNSGSNDRAILCGDVKNKYEMSGPGGACHGPNVALCLPGNCDNACYDCVGGSC